MSGQFDGALTLKEGDHTIYGSAYAVMAVGAIIEQRTELLEALESCIALFDEHDDCSDIDSTVAARNAARAAIAKARGAK